MKKLFLVFLLTTFCFTGYANHLKGGFFTYKYLGAGVNDPTKLRYQITLTVYMDCNASGQQVNNPINFTIFDASNNQFLQNISVPISNDYNLFKGQDEECITGNQRKCYYKIIEYNLPSIELAPNAGGYTISYQRCCRIGGIDNLVNSNTFGNTYSITIPGSSAGPDAFKNSSANFLVNDTAVVCGGSYFEIPFLATDPDGDELTFEFCNAWTGGSQGVAAPITASAPPYSTVPYQTGFNGFTPLGGNVTINSKTGLIKGIAPAAMNTGEYVITVCVNEFKNGVLTARTRKELHIVVGDCTPIKAVLKPSYITCDGFTLTFQNNVASNEIKSYYWEFGDGNTSTLPAPTYTYSDTGTYKLKLVVNRNGNCSDSTTSVVKVYPGFFPDFTFSGICVTKPTQFTDRTTTVYGVVDSWQWDFGETSSTTDVSSVQNPLYTYGQTGTKNVRLIVTNSKGCTDTLFKNVSIIDKPPLQVAFSDTLICRGDVIQLKATGDGIFSWTPGNQLSNANTATPTASPAVTTTYGVELNDNGCVNRDTVRVRVVNFVTLRVSGDTTICLGDPVQLLATSDALRYQWTPGGDLNSSTISNPIAIPSATTTYQVTAFIGGCNATDDVRITTVPYPTSNAGPDTVICFRTTAQLKGSIAGTSFTWSPTATLNNANTLSPVASPLSTIRYTLTVRDTLSGCPKPVSDTVLVKVLPKVAAFAGRDTAVVVGQPLQFEASGGSIYAWSPSFALNNPAIFNPVGTYDRSFDNIRYRVLVSTPEGCMDSAFVNVRVFRTNPQIFVPTAFTPNGDGKNDVIRPIAVGVSKIEYFRIYNRWGQLVFSTTINGKGWDGKIGGKEQGSNVYVWIVRGVDFTGKVVQAKGSVTLVR